MRVERMNVHTYISIYCFNVCLSYQEPMTKRMRKGMCKFPIFFKIGKARYLACITIL